MRRRRPGDGLESPRNCTVEDVIAGTAVTVTTDGTGGVVTDESGIRLPTRTAMWFAALGAWPDLTIGP